MYIHPDAILNKFKDVKIPSTQELFMQFGFKAPQGHGDDSSSGPDNIQGVDNLDKVMMQARSASKSAAEFEAKQRESEAQNVEEPKEVQQPEQ